MFVTSNFTTQWLYQLYWVFLFEECPVQAEAEPTEQLGEAIKKEQRNVEEKWFPC